MDLHLSTQVYRSKSAHNPNTDWFSRAGYGLFFHALPSHDGFSQFVREFDADRLATQCHDSGAGYVFFTLCQNSGLFNVPSEIYTQYSKRPELCSPRDIASELHRALSAYDIKLMLYIPAGAPKDDEATARGLGCIERDVGYTGDWVMTPTFTDRWCALLQELSQRYGDKVSGWWIDGFYQWSGADNGIARRYAEALKSGNKNAILAFNGGVNSYYYPSEYDDYIPGEWNDLSAPVCHDRWINGVQWHELSFISERWGGGALHRSASEIATHIRNVNQNGGVVSLDVPMQDNFSAIRADALTLMREVQAQLQAKKQ